ncbi:interleukin-21 receptor-like [Hypanus sabinus]|uniref:interleukin-21 receptor-like n=1 Tax=Hypanus sabinus TaxID=79690 RepID=UPI0028C408F2|nr:interleukin-21 receptor-like [Hypanus sabinus]
MCLTVKAQQSSKLICHVDYPETMNCTWTETRKDSNVTLEVRSSTTKEIKYRCTMSRLQPALEEGRLHAYFCTMNIRTFIQTYDLIVKTSSQANVSVVSGFKPNNHIQLKAPYHLTVTKNSTAQIVNISWKIDDGRYLRDCLEYELEYWTKETREDVKVKKVVNDIRHLVIQTSELEPDSEYRVRVRGKPSTKYQGTWSMWSAELKWKTDPASSTAQKSNLLLVVIAPLLLAIVIFVSLYFKLPSRVVAKVWVHIPNPASYFQPLYNQHNGNFKEWIHKDHAGDRWGGREESCQELRRVKKLPDNTAATVILNPWDEAVSNISCLKPIPVNHSLPFDLDTKSNLQTDPGNPFHHTRLLDYCNTESVLPGFLPLMLQEDNWALCQEPSLGLFLDTVPQEEEGGYSYSDEYCTLGHSDTSCGLVPAKIGLQVKVANKRQDEKREILEYLPMADGDSIPFSDCPAASQQSQEVCGSETPLQSQSPAEPSESPLNSERSFLTLSTLVRPAVLSTSSSL